MAMDQCDVVNRSFLLGFAHFLIFFGAYVKTPDQQAPSLPGLYGQQRSLSML